MSLAGDEGCLGARADPEQVQHGPDQHQATGMLGTPGVFVNGKRTLAGVNEIQAALDAAGPR